jgi:NAD(P)H-flavin reductase
MEVVLRVEVAPKRRERSVGREHGPGVPSNANTTVAKHIASGGETLQKRAPGDPVIACRMAETALAFRDSVVTAAWDETPTFRALGLDLGPLAPPHLRPGQVVKLRVPGGSEGYFALASAPGETARVLLKRGGAAANELIAAGSVGAIVECEGPFGAGFPVDAAVGRDVLLFAAGSGIAPIRALLRHLLDQPGRSRKIALWYGQRHIADFAFAAELDALRAEGVLITRCASRGVAEPGVTCGHVQDVAAAEGFGGLGLDGAVAYLCGMKAMVQGVRERLAVAGLPVERTYLNF